MNRYVLRWQYGLFNSEVKIHYTYGDIDTLREKAKVLAKNDKILVITIDKIEEIIKDTRTGLLLCDDCFIDLKRTISEMWTSV